MKYIIILILILLCGCAAQKPDSEQQVILLMGQSNMVGHPTSPGPTIAADLSVYHGESIGYINCAVGSTGIDAWIDHLYSECWDKVQQNQTVMGIFWYQGESDTYSKEAATTWLQKFYKLNTKGKVIFAAIATISPERQAEPEFAFWNLLRDAQESAGGVQTKDLQLNESGVHLTTESAIEVGHRMADKYIQELK